MRRRVAYGITAAAVAIGLIIGIWVLVRQTSSPDAADGVAGAKGQRDVPPWELPDDPESAAKSAGLQVSRMEGTATHFHSHLDITVNGQPLAVPSSLGVDQRTGQDRKECSRDLVDAARASSSTQQPHLAIAQLTSWRETATAIAAGLGSQPVEWLDEDAVAVSDDRQADMGVPEEGAVPRPTKRSEHVIKHASKQSEKGWRDLVATIGDSMSDAWDFLTRTPLTATATNYPLEGSLGVVARGSRTFQRWQHDITTKGTAQIWFYVDGGTVHLERVHAANPHGTE